jgi:plasmid stabilization system protein ParE
VREIVILLGAEIEMQWAYERCADWPQAERLETQVRASLGQLQEQPYSGRHYAGRFRRLLVRQSVYGLFYIVEANRVVIHAMLDLRQDPAAILQRLSR